MKKPIYLTPYELWFLFSYQGPAAIIGFQNPVNGLNTDEIFPLIQEATLSLIERNIITIDAESRLTAINFVEDYIKAITSPQHTILSSYKANNISNTYVNSFHFLEGKIVNLEYMDNKYLVCEYQDTEEILSLLIQPFSHKAFYAQDTGNLIFSKDTIILLQQALENHNLNNAYENLAAAKGDKLSKDHLWETFQKPLINFSFVVFSNRNNIQRKNIDGLSIIADNRYIWVFEDVDEKNSIVTATKFSVNDVYNKLRLKIPF